MSKSKPELKLVEDTGSLLDAEDLSVELPPLQSEMPFAVVEGEPMTQLPRDLYIPPDALQVFLEAFEGPLDLLLYLIRKQNLDILDIPIAEITRQYMKYIEVMADLQLELAGEYLLMAAMLAEIKSRMLLPRPPSADGHDEEDPRAELVRRLQEYERFKKAAEDIDRLSRQDRDTMAASAELQEHKVVKLLPDVTLQEMLLAFRDVLSRAEKFAHHHISRERLSQRERMSDILSRLQTVAFFEFTQLFKPEEGRMGVTVTFIAILELMKEGLIEIVQAEVYAPIHVRTAQRHLKVVPGGSAAAEADAENVAALAQPELVGENDLPDEDHDEPAADPAAVAVEAAVADVAAASAIAVDSIESGDLQAADTSLVTAAVSDAVAATESAVENIPVEVPVEEVPVAEALADPGVAIETAAAIESVARDESPAPVADISISDAATEDVLADVTPPGVVPEDVAGVVPSDSASEEGAAGVVLLDTARENVADVTLLDSAPEEGVPGVVLLDTAPENVADVTLLDTAPEDEATRAVAIVEVPVETVVEEHVVEEHVVPEHVVEENVVPEHVVQEPIAQAVEIVDAPGAVPESVEVVDEPVAATEAVEVVDEFVVATEAVEVGDEFVVAAEAVEVDDEFVVAAEAVDTVDDPVMAAEIVEETVGAAETAEVVEEPAAAEVAEEVVASIDVPAGDVIEDGVIEAEPQAEATLSAEPSNEVSVADDTVTGASGEDDNSDAESSR